MARCIDPPASGVSWLPIVHEQHAPRASTYRTYWPGSVSVTSPLPGTGTRWKSWICRSQEKIPITATIRQTAATASSPPAIKYQYRDGRSGPVPVLGCCPAVGIMVYPRAILRQCIHGHCEKRLPGKRLPDYNIGRRNG